MTLAESVKTSQRASMRSWLTWFAKRKPLLSPEEQKAEIEHFVKELKQRDEALAQLEAWGDEYDREHL